jgi:WhiB family redox-sensing transcriptional regulator
MTIFEECVLEAEVPPLQVLEADSDFYRTDNFTSDNSTGDSFTGDISIGSDATGDQESVWELQAACRSTKGAAELFFSEELAGIVAAKRICAECPVIAPCLEGALSRAEPCGVWGGQLFENGRVLHQKRRRGRPPKVPRPEDQLPAVPVPEHLQKLIA